ncbi:hypothetical protein [Calothrix sp. 336/3]|uniref:hypothetical protein n=1 Tax=Calothrix sp. 336/3 TaxID=1337936 RepID=UPI0004E2F787|nr:hypothetical protein [Calothrix sp. 336/3]AKG21793.1 hypothetical protein IJ00_11470 [Calothrix sp. 336/3]
MGLGAKNSSSNSKQSSSSVPQAWFKVLWFFLLLSIVAIALVNIKPYVDAVSALGLNVIGDTNLLSKIPFLNGIGLALGIGIAGLTGFCLWATFQLIEVLPVILYNHPGFLEEVIKDADSQTKYAIKDNDDPTVQVLKKTYNTLPTAFLDNLSRIRLAAYTLDFLICFWKYSPVESGKITDFFYFVLTGQWDRILFLNLVLALITLFGVELGLNLLLWVGKLAFTINRTQSTAR